MISNWRSFTLYLAVVFLAHHAWVMMDAIVRTVYRLGVSRKHLLEWRTAAVSKNLFDYKIGAFYRRMISAPLLTLSAVLILHVSGRKPFLGEWLPFIILWLLSPWIAQRLSLRSSGSTQNPLSAKDRLEFRLIARKTWRFFETFITTEHHHLPPDNFQEIPHPVIARRTSPTNIGLYLLSVAAARDFGWLGLTEAVERLEATIATIKDLKRYQGHLYNWYDTKDLRPLEPLYISTVDSGNLAGHLWTLGNACRAWQEQAIRSKPNIFAGLTDTLLLIEKAAAGLSPDRRAETVSVAQLHEALEDFRAALTALPASAS